MSQRPKWAAAIARFISDDVIDEKYEFPQDGSDDEVHSRIEDVALAAMCAEFGHEIIGDHCGKPDHRFCFWCSKRIGSLVRTEKDTVEGPPE